MTNTGAISARGADADPAARGVTRISPLVVERIAAFACHRADAAISPSTFADAPRSSAPLARAEVNGRYARLSVSAGVAYPSSLVAFADSVRRVVRDDVERLCGLDVVGVDVDAVPVNVVRKARVQ